ncbi:hypothetical protein HDV57DRAFT_491957 [Trichoderma longibrachiatum]
MVWPWLSALCCLAAQQGFAHSPSKQKIPSNYSPATGQRQSLAPAENPKVACTELYCSGLAAPVQDGTVSDSASTWRTAAGQHRAGHEATDGRNFPKPAALDAEKKLHGKPFLSMWANRSTISPAEASDQKNRPSG